MAKADVSMSPTVLRSLSIDTMMEMGDPSYSEG